MLRTRNCYSLTIVPIFALRCGRLRSLSYGRRDTAKVTPVPPGTAETPPAEDDIRARIHAVVKTFTPETPVSSLAELVGREASLRELLNIVASPGKHAFVASARGTGKTSLVSCFIDCASRAAPQITCVRTNCGNSSFKTIWSKVLRRIRARLGMASTQFDNPEISDLDVEFELVRVKTPLLIVFDHFDEILSHTELAQFATLMKVVSDNAMDISFIMVGSPGAAMHFKRTYILIQRHLRIITLNRLQPAKAQEVLVSCWRRCGLEIMDDAMSLAVKMKLRAPLLLPGNRQVCRSIEFVSEQKCDNRSRRRRGFEPDGRTYPFNERNQLKNRP